MIYEVEKKQMSDSLFVMILITISGGLQDAYTYRMRGGVFANAQTGNIVLLAGNLFHGEWGKVIHYLIPVLAFCSGVIIAEQIHGYCCDWKKIHWRQMVLFMEIILLWISGLFSDHYNYLANAAISCSCAMQVESFRKVNGYGYASTMCIGNLRMAMSSLSGWMRTRDEKMKTMFLQYAQIIFFFAIGAGMGHLVSDFWGLRTIWVSVVLLFVALLLMI